MAIFIVEGKPRAGKTLYTMINEVCRAVRGRRHVYTNIDGVDEILCQKAISEILDISIEQVQEHLHHVRSADELKELLEWDKADLKGERLKVPHKSLFVVDEAQMIWNSRDFKNTTKGFMDLLAYHGHFGFDFFFLTQDAKSLDAYVSRVCEACWTIKNLGFLSVLFKNRYIVQFKQKPRDPIVSSVTCKYDPRYFRTYRSFITQNPHVRNAPSALGGLKIAGFVLSVMYVSVKLYANGLFPGAKKIENRVSHPVGAVPVDLQKAVPVLPAQTNAGGPLAAAPAASSQVQPTGSAEASPTPSALPAAESVAACGDPKKVGYRVPTHGTWRIEYQGQVTEGVREGSKVVCF